MITSQELFQHWKNCQNSNDLRYDAFIQQGEKVAFSAKQWELKEIEIEEILNYKDSELEFSGPLIEKINKFRSYLKNVNDLPPIVLTPVDRKNKRPFIEHKYESKVKWEAADGVHRLHLIIGLGLSRVKGYIPVKEGEND